MIAICRCNEAKAGSENPQNKQWHRPVPWLATKKNLKIKNNENVRFTRSQLGPTFVPPNSKLKTVGDRSYRVSIPQLWNELPLNLRCVESLNSFILLNRSHSYASRSQWWYVQRRHCDSWRCLRLSLLCCSYFLVSVDFGL